MFFGASTPHGWLSVTGGHCVAAAPGQGGPGSGPVVASPWLSDLGRAGHLLWTPMAPCALLRNTSWPGHLVRWLGGGVWVNVNCHMLHTCLLSLQKGGHLWRVHFKIVSGCLGQSKAFSDEVHSFQCLPMTPSLFSLEVPCGFLVENASFE